MRPAAGRLRSGFILRRDGPNLPKVTMLLNKVEDQSLHPLSFRWGLAYSSAESPTSRQWQYRRLATCRQRAQTK